MTDTAPSWIAALLQSPPNSSGLHKAVAVEHVSDCECARCIDRDAAMDAWEKADTAYQEGFADVEPEQPAEVMDTYCDTCQDPGIVRQHGGDVTHSVRWPCRHATKTDPTGAA